MRAHIFIRVYAVTTQSRTSFWFHISHGTVGGILVSVSLSRSHNERRTTVCGNSATKRVSALLKYGKVAMDKLARSPNRDSRTREKIRHKCCAQGNFHTSQCLCTWVELHFSLRGTVVHYFKYKTHFIAAFALNSTLLPAVLIHGLAKMNTSLFFYEYALFYYLQNT